MNPAVYIWDIKTLQNMYDIGFENLMMQLELHPPPHIYIWVSIKV